MISTGINQDEAWQDRPLCRGYRLLRFAASLLQVRAGTAANTWPVTWALGATSDGQSEVVGVWQHSIEGVLNWQAVFNDLSARGVERIRYAVHVDAAAALAVFPDLTVINSPLPESGDLEVLAATGAQALTETRRALDGRRCDTSEPPRRVLQLARRVDQAAQLLQRRLSQAATRHGPVESGSAAAEFVEAWLANDEVRERRRRLAMQRATGVGAAAMAR